MVVTVTAMLQVDAAARNLSCWYASLRDQDLFFLFICCQLCGEVENTLLCPCSQALSRQGLPRRPAVAAMLQADTAARSLSPWCVPERPGGTKLCHKSGVTLGGTRPQLTQIPAETVHAAGRCNLSPWCVPDFHAGQTCQVQSVQLQWRSGSLPAFPHPSLSFMPALTAMLQAACLHGGHLSCNQVIQVFAHTSYDCF